MSYGHWLFKDITKSGCGYNGKMGHYKADVIHGELKN